MSQQPLNPIQLSNQLFIRAPKAVHVGERLEITILQICPIAEFSCFQQHIVSFILPTIPLSGNEDIVRSPSKKKKKNAEN